MKVTKEKIDNYISMVYVEMERRGVAKDKIRLVIDKTGFIDAIEKYLEVQLHYPVESAVDEILLTAAQN